MVMPVSSAATAALETEVPIVRITLLSPFAAEVSEIGTTRMMMFGAAEKAIMVPEETKIAPTAISHTEWMK